MFAARAYLALHDPDAPRTPQTSRRHTRRGSAGRRDRWMSRTRPARGGRLIAWESGVDSSSRRMIGLASHRLPS